MLDARRVTLVFCLLTAASSRAQTPKRIRIVESVGACPAAKDVQAVLEQSLTGVWVSTDEATAEDVVVQLWDEGTSYRVRVGTSAEKEFVDSARRCDERAKAVAVFIAVTTGLFEASAAPPAPSLQPPPPSTPQPPASSSVDVRARIRARIELELAGLFGGAPNADVTGGGSARFAITAHRAGGQVGVGGSIGAAGLAPTSLDLAGGRARLIRVPADVSLRFQYRRGRWQLDADAGLSLAVLIVSGQGLANPTRQTVLDLGVRGALSATLWLSRRVAPFVSLEATGSPSRYQLAVHDSGIVGQTPAIWIAGALGIKLNLL